ncbi:MAG TPA: GGDEF domain-containing phosphodiesterase, partial [Gammaproteobacteria bacterium]|nr:GGDEF domain-containing phosphodiesterase [Gammaproteobacteria bacterium]
ADAEAAAATAEHILWLLTEPFVIGDQELFATASIGISCFPADGDDPSVLLRAADAAMYKAKDEGRNTYQFYSTELNVQALESLTIANRLRTAVERDEFFLDFQPIVELKTQRIKSVEALIRWQHPELGLVPPMRFIPVAEQTGLILEIGTWVLETACRQAAAWQKNGMCPLVVAVNVSLRQLRQRDFAKQVAHILEKTGLAPEYLKLEITETTVMDNPERAIRLFAEVAKTGVKIAIDDFGIGYSSLNYLKRLPIDYLKIDRSFVKDLPDNADDAAITRAIIAMAHSLGLRLVAEGIEETSQFDFLRQAGCEEGQGFLFSKPARPDDLKRILRKGKVA